MGFLFLTVSQDVIFEKYQVTTTFVGSSSEEMFDMACVEV